MATSSFNKRFIINDKKAAHSFAEIISKPQHGKEIDKDLVNYEKEQQGVEKLKQLLSR